MKNLFLYLLTLTLAISSCHDQGLPDGEYTTNLRQANKLFQGTWKLTKIMAQIPNPPVPNVRIIVSGNQITLFKDSKQIDKVDYAIIKTDDYLQLKTNAKPELDNWYIRNGIIKISNNKIFLDTGMAYDAPGYTFEKVK